MRKKPLGDVGKTLKSDWVAKKTLQRYQIVLEK
jgi:hypothetical protein